MFLLTSHITLIQTSSMVSQVRIHVPLLDDSTLIDVAATFDKNALIHLCGSADVKSISEDGTIESYAIVEE
jgi:hypothetical protein